MLDELTLWNLSHITKGRWMAVFGKESRREPFSKKVFPGDQRG
jgi:hypothetical protein